MTDRWGGYRGGTPPNVINRGPNAMVSSLEDIIADLRRWQCSLQMGTITAVNVDDDTVDIMVEGGELTDVVTTGSFGPASVGTVVPVIIDRRGNVVVLGETGISGGGGGGAMPTIVVAAEDAAEITKSRADAVCTGDFYNRVDHLTIRQAAIDAAGSLVHIQLSEGTYWLGDSIDIPTSIAFSMSGLPGSQPGSFSTGGAMTQIYCNTPLFASSRSALKLTDMTIGSLSTPVSSLRVSAANIERVKVELNPGQGTTNDLINCNTISDSFISGFGVGNGILGGTVVTARNWVTNCVIEYGTNVDNTSFRAITFTPHGREPPIVSGCRIEYSGTQGGVFFPSTRGIVASTPIRVLNCDFDIGTSIAASEVIVAEQGSYIVNNRFHFDGTIAKTGGLIKLTGGVSGWSGSIITGNRCTFYTPEIPRPTQGIVLQDPSNSIITGNSLVVTGTGIVATGTSSGNIVTNNRITGGGAISSGFGASDLVANNL